MGWNCWSIFFIDAGCVCLHGADLVLDGNEKWSLTKLLSYGTEPAWVLVGKRSCVSAGGSVRGVALPPVLHTLSE